MRNYWTEERFLKEYYEHPFLKDFEIIKGFENTSTKIIVKGPITNHHFYPKSMYKFTSFGIHNSTDKRVYKIYQFNLIHNDLYTYDIYEPVKNSEYMSFTCKIHGDKTIPQSNHMKGFGCNECSTLGAPSLTNYDFINSLKDVPDDFEILEDYNGYHTPLLCKNRFGYLKVAPQNLLKGLYGSIRTAIDKVSYKKSHLREIHNNTYDYPNFFYENNHSIIDIECKIHGIFQQKSYVHQMGHGCTSCAFENKIGGYTRTDFIKNANGRRCSTYFIRCWNDEEEFYKIGITMRTIKKRFAEKKTMPYNWEVLSKKQSFDAGLVYDTEKFLLREYKEHSYRPSIEFHGISECFNLSLPIEEIKLHLLTYN